MFFRHGIKMITMDDIATSLKISKKTIYNYYRDKAQLVQSFTDLEIQNQEAEMNDISAKSNDAINEIMNVMTHLSNFFKRVNPAVFYDLQKYHPQSWNSFRKFKEKALIGFVENNLRNGIHQNLYRRELKVKILARLRIEEVEMGFNPVVFPQDRFSISEVQLALIDHYLHGIVTLKGYKLIEKYKRTTRINKKN